MAHLLVMMGNYKLLAILLIVFVIALENYVEAQRNKNRRKNNKSYKKSKSKSKYYGKYPFLENNDNPEVALVNLNNGDDQLGNVNEPFIDEIHSRNPAPPNDHSNNLVFGNNMFSDPSSGRHSHSNNLNFGNNLGSSHSITNDGLRGQDGRFNPDTEDGDFLKIALGHLQNSDHQLRPVNEAFNREFLSRNPAPRNDHSNNLVFGNNLFSDPSSGRLSPSNNMKFGNNLESGDSTTVEGQDGQFNNMQFGNNVNNVYSTPNEDLPVRDGHSNNLQFGNNLGNIFSATGEDRTGSSHSTIDGAFSGQDGRYNTDLENGDYPKIALGHLHNGDPQSRPANEAFNREFHSRNPAPLNDHSNNLVFGNNLFSDHSSERHTHSNNLKFGNNLGSSQSTIDEDLSAQNGQFNTDLENGDYPNIALGHLHNGDPQSRPANEAFNREFHSRNSAPLNDQSNNLVFGNNLFTDPSSESHSPSNNLKFGNNLGSGHSTIEEQDGQFNNMEFGSNLGSGHSTIEEQDGQFNNMEFGNNLGSGHSTIEEQDGQFNNMEFGNNVNNVHSTPNEDLPLHDGHSNNLQFGNNLGNIFSTTGEDRTEEDNQRNNLQFNNNLVTSIPTSEEQSKQHDHSKDIQFINNQNNDNLTVGERLDGLYLESYNLQFENEEDSGILTMGNEIVDKGDDLPKNQYFENYLDSGIPIVDEVKDWQVTLSNASDVDDNRDSGALTVHEILDEQHTQSENLQFENNEDLDISTNSDSLQGEDSHSNELHISSDDLMNAVESANEQHTEKELAPCDHQKTLSVVYPQWALPYHTHATSINYNGILNAHHPGSMSYVGYPGIYAGQWLSPYLTQPSTNIIVVAPTSHETSRNHPINAYESRGSLQELISHLFTSILPNMHKDMYRQPYDSDVFEIHDGKNMHLMTNPDTKHRTREHSRNNHRMYSNNPLIQNSPYDYPEFRDTLSSRRLTPEYFERKGNSKLKSKRYPGKYSRNRNGDRMFIHESLDGYPEYEGDDVLVPPRENFPRGKEASHKSHPRRYPSEYFLKENGDDAIISESIYNFPEFHRRRKNKNDKNSRDGFSFKREGTRKRNSKKYPYKKMGNVKGADVHELSYNYPGYDDGIRYEKVSFAKDKPFGKRQGSRKSFTKKYPGPRKNSERRIGIPYELSEDNKYGKNNEFEEIPSLSKYFNPQKNKSRNLKPGRKSGGNIPDEDLKLLELYRYLERKATKRGMSPEELMSDKKLFKHVLRNFERRQRKKMKDNRFGGKGEEIPLIHEPISGYPEYDGWIYEDGIRQLKPSRKSGGNEEDYGANLITDNEESLREGDDIVVDESNRQITEDVSETQIPIFKYEEYGEWNQPSVHEHVLEYPENDGSSVSGTATGSSFQEESSSDDFRLNTEIGDYTMNKEPEFPIPVEKGSIYPENDEWGASTTTTTTTEIPFYEESNSVDFRLNTEPGDNTILEEPEFPIPVEKGSIYPENGEWKFLEAITESPFQEESNSGDFRLNIEPGDYTTFKEPEFPIPVEKGSIYPENDEWSVLTATTTESPFQEENNSEDFRLNKETGDYTILEESEYPIPVEKGSIYPESDEWNVLTETMESPFQEESNSGYFGSNLELGNHTHITKKPEENVWIYKDGVWYFESRGSSIGNGGENEGNIVTMENPFQEESNSDDLNSNPELEVNVQINEENSELPKSEENGWTYHEGVWRLKPNDTYTETTHNHEEPTRDSFQQKEDTDMLQNGETPEEMSPVQVFISENPGQDENEDEDALTHRHEVWRLNHEGKANGGESQLSEEFSATTEPNYIYYDDDLDNLQEVINFRNNKNSAGYTDGMNTEVLTHFSEYPDYNEGGNRAIEDWYNQAFNTNQDINSIGDTTHVTEGVQSVQGTVVEKLPEYDNGIDHRNRNMKQDRIPSPDDKDSDSEYTDYDDGEWDYYDRIWKVKRGRNSTRKAAEVSDAASTVREPFYEYPEYDDGGLAFHHINLSSIFGRNSTRNVEKVDGDVSEVQEPFPEYPEYDENGLAYHHINLSLILGRNSTRNVENVNGDVSAVQEPFPEYPEYEDGDWEYRHKIWMKKRGRNSTKNAGKIKNDASTVKEPDFEHPEYVDDEHRRMLRLKHGKHSTGSTAEESDGIPQDQDHIIDYPEYDEEDWLYHEKIWYLNPGKNSTRNRGGNKGNASTSDNLLLEENTVDKAISDDKLHVNKQEPEVVTIVQEPIIEHRNYEGGIATDHDGVGQLVPDTAKVVSTKKVKGGFPSFLDDDEDDDSEETDPLLRFLERQAARRVYEEYLRRFKQGVPFDEKAFFDETFHPDNPLIKATAAPTTTTTGSAEGSGDVLNQENHSVDGAINSEQNSLPIDETHVGGNLPYETTTVDDINSGGQLSGEIDGNVVVTHFDTSSVPEQSPTETIPLFVSAQRLKPGNSIPSEISDENGELVSVQNDDALGGAHVGGMSDEGIDGGVEIDNHDDQTIQETNIHDDQTIHETDNYDTQTQPNYDDVSLDAPVETTTEIIPPSDLDIDEYDTVEHHVIDEYYHPEDETEEDEEEEITIHHEDTDESPEDDLEHPHMDHSPHPPSTHPYFNRDFHNHHPVGLLSGGMFRNMHKFPFLHRMFGR